MAAEQSDVWMSPAVELYEVAAEGNHGEPRIVFVKESVATQGRTTTPDLVIVSGPLRGVEAAAQAVRIAARQAEWTLVLAVVYLDEGSDAMPEQAVEVRPELYAAFDSVFVVRPCASGDLVERLIRAITAPGGPDQHIGCDWNDVRYVVAGCSDGRPAGYGFGRGTGEERASVAAAAAISKLAQNGRSLDAARGVSVSITAAPPGLLGREVKEVFRHIRERLHDAANVVQCMGRDDSLEAGTLEVSIIAFGTQVEGTPCP